MSHLKLAGKPVHQAKPVFTVENPATGVMSNLDPGSSMKPSWRLGIVRENKEWRPEACTISHLKLAGKPVHQATPVFTI